MAPAADDRRSRSRWFPRHVLPVHPGVYECGVVITSSQRHLFLWALPWDGVGFLVPCPMVVKQWRGLARRPTTAAMKVQGAAPR